MACKPTTCRLIAHLVSRGVEERDLLRLVLVRDLFAACRAVGRCNSGGGRNQAEQQTIHLSSSHMQANPPATDTQERNGGSAGGMAPARCRRQLPA